MSALPADDFTIGIVYVKPLEMHAITPMLDVRYLSIPPIYGDNNDYILGRIGDHNVVVVGPARGGQGTVVIAQSISTITVTFPNVKFGLLVGIGGGVPYLPDHDVRLGDIVVGAPEKGPAVVQYSLGRRTTDGTEAVGSLSKPPPSLLRVINNLENQFMLQQDGEDPMLHVHLKRLEKYSNLKRYLRPSLNDRLFQSDYIHPMGSNCQDHEIKYEVARPPRNPDVVAVHYSTILSGDLVMKSSADRDALSRAHNNALCFEMEAAGLMDVFPCLVIRGICDYADSHKSDDWQRYAAATAAAYAREVLLNLPRSVTRAPTGWTGVPKQREETAATREPRGTEVHDHADGSPSRHYLAYNNYGSQVGTNRGNVTNYFGSR